MFLWIMSDTLTSYDVVVVFIDELEIAF